MSYRTQVPSSLDRGKRKEGQGRGYNKVKKKGKRHREEERIGMHSMHDEPFWGLVFGAEG